MIHLFENRNKEGLLCKLEKWFLLEGGNGCDRLWPMEAASSMNRNVLR